jgi:hypothetical protein
MLLMYVVILVFMLMVFMLFMCVLCVSCTGVMTLAGVSIMLEVINAFKLRFGDDDEMVRICAKCERAQGSNLAGTRQCK